VIINHAFICSEMQYKRSMTKLRVGGGGQNIGLVTDIRSRLERGETADIIQTYAINQWYCFENNFLVIFGPVMVAYSTDLNKLRGP
jgi:hypothetical protein